MEKIGTQLKLNGKSILSSGNVGKTSLHLKFSGHNNFRANFNITIGKGLQSKIRFTVALQPKNKKQKKKKNVFFGSSAYFELPY